MIDANHLEFGNGDIGIHMSDTSVVALLVFRNLKKPAPIGRLLNSGKARDMERRKSDVLMSFTNTESIDVLINCLLHIRRKVFE